MTKRSITGLSGLWDTLAPASSVLRTSPTTTVIQEPGVPEVRVRHNNIAKIVKKDERSIPLWKFPQRRPLLYKKTTEEKIAFRLIDE